MMMMHFAYTMKIADLIQEGNRISSKSPDAKFTPSQIGTQISSRLHKFQLGREWCLDNDELSDLIELFDGINTVEHWTELCAEPESLWTTTPPTAELHTLLDCLAHWCNQYRVTVV